MGRSLRLATGAAFTGRTRTRQLNSCPLEIASTSIYWVILSAVILTALRVLRLKMKGARTLNPISEYSHGIVAKEYLEEWIGFHGIALSGLSTTVKDCLQEWMGRFGYCTSCSNVETGP